MPAPDYAALGEVIKIARSRRQWSQEQLAEAAGMSLRTVQNYERGTIKSPSLEGYIRVLEALDLDLEAARRFASQINILMPRPPGNK